MTQDDKITITMTIPVSELPLVARFIEQQKKFAESVPQREKKKSPNGISKESVDAAFRKHHLIVNGFKLGRLKETIPLEKRQEELRKNRGIYVRAAEIARDIYENKGGFKLLPNSWLAGCIVAACPDGSERELSDAEKFFRDALFGNSDFCAVNALHKELMDDHAERTKGVTQPNRTNLSLDTIKKIFKALSIYKAHDQFSALLANRLDGVTLPK